MASINRVVLEGELVADPVLREGGAAFQLLVVTMTKDRETQEWVGRPNRFDVVAWGPAGEDALTTLRTGHPVGVEGALAWEPASDTSLYQRVHVVADKVRLLSARAAEHIPSPPEATAGDPAPSSEQLGAAVAPDGAPLGAEAA